MKRKKQRRWVSSFGELVDRLSICSQKEIFISDKRDTYSSQISDILHDIQLYIDENELVLTGEMIRLIVIITHMNSWIWENEKNRRNNIQDGNDLSLSHSLNSIRTTAYSKLSVLAGDRGEYKVDSAIPDPKWIPSGL